MRKVRRIVLGILCAVVMLTALSSCARSFRISPEGLRETIESFELLDISVRLVTYSPPRYSIAIEIVILDKIIPDEYISLLISVMSEYFRGQQFTDFVNSGIHGIDPDHLSIGLHIFATDRGRIMHTGFNASDDFVR